MKAVDFYTSLVEVPGEISLVVSISGCPFKCKNCHSSYLQNENEGVLLNSTLLKEHLHSLHTCICFFGGEQYFEEFSNILHWCKNKGLRTALYTGNNKIDTYLVTLLNYVKLGAFNGYPLNDKRTNQKFYILPYWENITNKFQQRTFNA